MGAGVGGGGTNHLGFCAVWLKDGYTGLYPVVQVEKLGGAGRSILCV